MDVTLFRLKAIEMRMKVLQRGVLFRGKEVGTGLGDMGQLAVAKDLGIGVVLLQRLQQCPQGVLLGLGASVGRMTVGEQAALVADTDRVGVEVAGVSTDEVLVPGLVGLSVSRDVIVVSREAEAGLMTGNERGDRKRAVFARRRTVNDNHIYPSHAAMQLWVRNELTTAVSTVMMN